MRFSEHFARFRSIRPDRARISLEMCAAVVDSPLAREVQESGRVAYWGFVESEARYLKVVVERDSEEIVTAHWDRGFRRRMEDRRTGQ